MCAEYGPTPVAEAIRICEELIAAIGRRPQGRGDRAAERSPTCTPCAATSTPRATSTGAPDAMLEELGWTFIAALGSIVSGPIEMLAGDPVAAEAELRRDYETLDRLGDRNYISTVAAYLAEALYRQGRFDEARHDGDLQRRGRRARRRRHAGRAGAACRPSSWPSGASYEEAERLGREAVELSRREDDPIDQANALMDLGHVLRAGGRARRGDGTPRTEALRLYERKGNVVSAAAARQFIADASARGTLSGARSAPDMRQRARVGRAVIAERWAARPMAGLRPTSGSPSGRTPEARTPKNATLCWFDFLKSTHGPTSFFLQAGRRPVKTWRPTAEGRERGVRLQQMLYCPMPLVTSSELRAKMIVFGACIGR